MVVAIAALFVALGGTGYAALELPRHSVGKKQLKANAVTTTKVDDGTLRLKDFRRSELRRLTGGEPGADGADGFDGLDGADGTDGENGADGATGSALLTGSAGGLPSSGDPAERAALNGNSTATTMASQVASLSPNRELVLRNLSVAALDTATVTVEVVATPFNGSGEDVVIGCTVTGTNRTCTDTGPDTLPANHLIYMRLTVTGAGTTPGRVYWGVSAEPAGD